VAQELVTRNASGVLQCSGGPLIYSLGERRVELAGDDYFVAPDAQVIGSVRLGHASSVWFGCIIRGDSDWISIGDGTNIQDGTVIHTDSGEPTSIGNDVTIGHRVLLHSCTIAADTLIGNGAMVLDGASVGRNCVVAAGSLITPGKHFPDGSVIMGSPGKVVRPITKRDLAMIRHATSHYRERLHEYRRLLQVDPRSH
jgi:carbonic anhydrase/acetyltransferase-like protein (isoleucine patch superfamily)